MTSVPPAFVRRLNSHNRHALLAALFSFIAAAVVWAALYAGGQLLVMLALTSAFGEAARLPEFYGWAFAGLVVFLLTLAAIVRTVNPFPRIDDRPILGWHVFWQLLLSPALLTFAIYDNLNAYRRLAPGVVRRAWELLLEIQRGGKLRYPEIGQLGIEADQTEALLTLLQFAGYVDLHHGREEWFYLIRSSEAEAVKALVAAS